MRAFSIGENTVEKSNALCRCSKTKSSVFHSMHHEFTVKQFFLAISSASRTILVAGVNKTSRPPPQELHTSQQLQEVVRIFPAQHDVAKEVLVPNAEQLISNNMRSNKHARATRTLVRTTCPCLPDCETMTSLWPLPRTVYNGLSVSKGKIPPPHIKTKFLMLDLCTQIRAVLLKSTLQARTKCEEKGCGLGT